MKELRVASAVVGSIGTNCYFLMDEEKNEVLIVDPADSADKIYELTRREGWEIKGILLTHGHADHIGGANRLRELSGAKIYAPAMEESMLLDPDKNMSLMILRANITVKADVLVSDGDEITISDMKLKVLHTPGHTPGGCSYYCEQAGLVFAGDTLFAQSVGRTDFPGGSMSQIVRSIKEKLFTLPDSTIVYPGHGEYTSIADEKKYNPYVG